MFIFKKRGDQKRSGLSRVGRTVAIVMVVSVLSVSVLTVKPKPAHSLCITVSCWSCGVFDCLVAALLVYVLKSIFTPIIENNLEDHVNSEQNWILDEFFEDYWVVGVAELREFLVAFGMYQVEMVGMFMDAKQHLETRRLFNQMTAEAHRDYHPSEDLCWYGTNSRSLAATERRGDINKLFLSERSLNRQLGVFSAPGASGNEVDDGIRWHKFVNENCDPKDNAWTAAGSGLDFACDRDGLGAGTAAGAATLDRKNRDINYTRLLDEPRTLAVNFADTNTPTTVPADEQDVLSMSSFLFGDTVLPRELTRESLKKDDAAEVYVAMRSIIAKRSVAQNSFNAIVALKSEGTNGSPATATPEVGTFMAALIRDLMPATPADADVYAILGRNPSYYAQLEFLAKKIYQSPRFFADLYDKPANVDRKSVAMKAVDLMLDRALYESELRQEMILSVLLSSDLTPEYRKINKDLANTKGKR